MNTQSLAVQLCTKGMTAEAEGKLDEARAFFRQAWDERADAFEGCVAAHYLARNQTPEKALEWNQKALECADSVGDDRVKPFYSSLLASIGVSLLALGDPVEAKEHFDFAEARMGDLPDGPYRDLIARSIAAGRAKISTTESG